MTTHTPGPWTVTQDSATDHGIHGGGNRLIAMAFGSDGERHEFSPDLRTGIANARLIAAAPELLAALEAIIVSADAAEWPEQDAVDAMLLAARAAIARAKGE